MLPTFVAMTLRRWPRLFLASPGTTIQSLLRFLKQVSFAMDRWEILDAWNMRRKFVKILDYDFRNQSKYCPLFLRTNIFENTKNTILYQFSKMVIIWHLFKVILRYYRSEFKPEKRRHKNSQQKLFGGTWKKWKIVG